MTTSAAPGTGLRVDPAELSRRALRARAMLQSCALCEWRCGVDRTRGDCAPCLLADETSVFKQYVSVTEELEVVPALRVYLGGCNFRCRFCDTAPQCFEPAADRRLVPSQYGPELAAALRRGVRGISVLGGEPTLHVHTLLEAAAAAPESLPLILNTNLYATPEVLELLEGVVALYLADFKFGGDACALQLAGVPNYSAVVRRNLQQICGQTLVIVRHLLMPGHFDCCFRAVVDWCAAHLPGSRFQLYTGYVPCWRASEDAQIGRLNTPAEQQAAVEYLRTTNLDWSAGADGATAR